MRTFLFHSEKHMAVGSLRQLDPWPGSHNLCSSETSTLRHVSLKGLSKSSHLGLTHPFPCTATLAWEPLLTAQCGKNAPSYPSPHRLSFLVSSVSAIGMALLPPGANKCL